SNDVCGSDDYLESFSTTAGTTNITNSNSGCSPNTGTAINNYSDNSATMIHTAVQGTVVNYSLTNNNHWEEGYRIWVDWNGDGDFDDAGEEVYYSNGNVGVGATVTGSFSVPFTAAVGTTRLRIRGVYNDNF